MSSGSTCEKKKILSSVRVVHTEESKFFFCVERMSRLREGVVLAGNLFMLCVCSIVVMPFLLPIIVSDEWWEWLRRTARYRLHLVFFLPAFVLLDHWLVTSCCALPLIVAGADVLLVSVFKPLCDDWRGLPNLWKQAETCKAIAGALRETLMRAAGCRLHVPFLFAVSLLIHPPHWTVLCFVLPPLLFAAESVLLESFFPPVSAE